MKKLLLSTKNFRKSLKYAFKNLSIELRITNSHPTCNSFEMCHINFTIFSNRCYHFWNQKKFIRTPIFHLLADAPNVFQCRWCSSPIASNASCFARGETYRFAFYSLSSSFDSEQDTKRNLLQNIANKTEKIMPTNFTLNVPHFSFRVLQLQYLLRFFSPRRVAN